MSIDEIRTAVLRPNSQASCDLLKAAGIKYPNHQARLVYLAYAYLRGVPYRVVEPTARPLFDSMGHYQDTFLRNLVKLVNHTNRKQVATPDPGLLAKVLAKLTGKEPTAPAYVTPAYVTTGTITVWLSLPETPARKERRLAREAKSMAKRMARRAAFLETVQRAPQRVA